MKVIYSLLHFSKRVPKHLLLSIPDTVPDVTKEEGAIISIESEGNSQAFTLSTTEISAVIVALSYAREMLKWRRIAGINQKYSKKGGDE